jgi:hypothetical protein
VSLLTCRAINKQGPVCLVRVSLALRPDATSLRAMNRFVFNSVRKHIFTDVNMARLLGRLSSTGCP